MLSITHATTGAFLASKISNPVFAIPVILASHYLEDWILHWDVGTGLTNGSRKRRDAFFLELIDFAAAGVLVFHFFGGVSNLQPWMGAFVGLLPDFMEAPRNFLHWNPVFLKPFNRFHHSLHRSTPDIVRGLAPQIILLAAIFFLR